MPLTFRLAMGFSFQRRGIGFLEDAGDETLDAGATFDGLAGNTERKVRSEMDYWLQGGVHDEWFHGWPNLPEYKQCFSFRWKERRLANRLYGFLCHPMPQSNPRFELCVLIYHDVKHETETDFTILDNVNTFRESDGATRAIGHTYPEYKKKGKSQWIN
jgi:hypothetical protein